MKSVKIDYLKEAQNLEQLKKLFKKLAFELHPDRGGVTAEMQKLNLEYEFLLKTGKFGTAEELEFNLIFPELINKLLDLEGLIIEIIGQWLWVSGETKKHRKTLKNLGLWYASKKQMWYFRNDADKKIWNRSKPMDIDDIRFIYRSNIVDKNTYKAKTKTKNAII